VRYLRGFFIMRRFFGGLWRSPNFARLWAGQTISLFGTQIGGAALRFTAILVLAATPFQLSLLGAAALLPALLLALPVGVWVDRVRRRPLLIAADLGRAALLLSVPAAFLLGVLRIEQLYLVAVLSGALAILFDTAYPAFVPSVVRREELVEANSKLGASESLAEIGGQSIGGLLVQLFSAPLAVAFDALSFVVSALALRGVRATEGTEVSQGTVTSPPQAAVTDERSPNVRRELSEGFAAIRGQPVLLALLGIAVTQSLAGGIIGTLYDVYLLRELGLGPALIGLTVGIGGIGSLAGAFLADPVVRRFGVRSTMAVTLLVGWGMSLLLPLAHGPRAFWFVAALQLSDVVGAIFAINALSLRQRVTPDRLLGRVNAGFNTGTLGAALCGTLAGGVLAQTLGIRTALVISVAIGAMAVLWLLRMGAPDAEPTK
jgi:MFS family permease